MQIGDAVYRITNRGGKGVKTINVTEKTGGLVGILDVTEKEDLIITCKSGITLRTPVANIKQSGRATQGVTLIRLDGGDEIAAISKIEEAEIVIDPVDTTTTDSPSDNISDNTPDNVPDNTPDSSNI